MLWGNDGPTYPPLFIVGLPRGGTTLIYQCICFSMSAAYPTELTNWLPFCPSVATRFTHRFRKLQVEYRSNYGRSLRLAYPGEGAMWNLWLSKHRLYESADQLTVVERRELLRLVGRIERQTNRPFVNKNLRHNQRLRMLAELFPSAMFLVVVRSPLRVAVSLLRGRREAGDINAWFSIEPQDHKLLIDLPPEQAVVKQVQHLLRDLQVDMAAIEGDRCRVLGYEEFCQSPRQALLAIEHWLGSHGSPLVLQNEPPELFDASNRTEGVAPEQLGALQNYLSELSLPELGPRLIGGWKSSE